MQVPRGHPMGGFRGFLGHDARNLGGHAIGPDGTGRKGHRATRVLMACVCWGGTGRHGRRASRRVWVRTFQARPGQDVRLWDEGGMLPFDQMIGDNRRHDRLGHGRRQRASSEDAQRARGGRAGDRFNVLRASKDAYDRAGVGSFAEDCAENISIHRACKMTMRWTLSAR